MLIDDHKHILKLYVLMSLNLTSLSFIAGREQDDMVAMGTLWSPNNGNQGQQPTHPQPGNRNSVSNSNTNSYSKVASSGSMNNSTNNTLNSQRKYPSSRPIVVQNNVPGKKNNNSKTDDGELGRWYYMYS